MRIITDDAKADDLGSDIDRLGRPGIAVRVDRSPFHMHHKFAIVDGATLLTGSYNWTRGAARDNEENLIVTDEPRLVSAFASTFDGSGRGWPDPEAPTWRPRSTTAYIFLEDHPLEPPPNPPHKGHRMNALHCGEGWGKRTPATTSSDPITRGGPHPVRGSPGRRTCDGCAASW